MPTSSKASSSLIDFDNNNENDERYALEVVKRAQNLEWTLVLATLARDKKTLLELIDLKTSDVMYNAWRHAVESCIEDDADTESATTYFREGEDGDFVLSDSSSDSETRRDVEQLKSYKRAFFAQLLADMHTESKREQKKKRGSQLNILIPDVPQL